jgi:hypothetical protein
MKLIQKLLTTLVMLVLVLSSGCGEVKEPSSDRKIQISTEEAMSEANKQIGLPAIMNFQEKKLMKMIYELRDQENLVCHAYLFNRETGTVGQYLGECIGYGIPYSTQFSNPSKYISDPHGSYDAGSIVMPQAEPNGLFMPEGLSATWLLLIDPSTKQPRPVYIEPEIIVSPFKLK